MLVCHGGDKPSYRLIGNFREKIAERWPASKLAWFALRIAVCYPKTSKPVNEDNLKLSLMMALRHERGSRFNEEILETAVERCS